MIAQVIVDISNDNVDRVFDYNAKFPLKNGSRVIVSFLNRKVQGFVIGLKQSTDYEGKLKDIEEVLDDGFISQDMLDLMDYMTDKYNLRKIDVLRLYLPPNMRDGKVKELRRKFVTLNPEIAIEQMKERIRPSQVRQLELIDTLDGEGEFLNTLTTLYGGTVKTLIDKGFLCVSNKAMRREPLTQVGLDDRTFDLTVSQNVCVNAINEVMRASQHKKFLLHGVTGSGKTEVYMRIIEAAIRQDKTAVMLVPEIALTAQFYKLFKGRFYDDVAIIHSGLSFGERFDEWKRILLRQARVVIGARSAIFAPLEDIGVVIVDEEHDGSYISESNPRFDARDVAAFRAKANGAVLVLGSATPSIDTYYRCSHGEFELLTMPERINKKQMPEIEIVDMCRELREGNNGTFSRCLEESLRKTLENGNQAMIYLNRRGYSSFVICRECGFVAKCSECDISLTYHIDQNVLKCHYCAKKFYMLECCNDCKSTNLRYGKTGTEKVVQELKVLFKDAKILRMDNDTTRQKDAYEKILSAFSRGEADILVGTQMIAKGHDFANVTLVGILDADMSLYFSDYRSAERTFQLVTQVSGRAGREKKSGDVVLQTYVPNHYVFRLAKKYDYNGFYDKEINARETTKYPPFTLIVRVLVSSDEDVSAMGVARKVYNNLRDYAKGEDVAKSFVYLNAMRPPIARLQGKHRYQILVRVKVDQKTDDIVKNIYMLADAEKIEEVTVFTELNPQNLA